jgi:hypothetical protein
MLQTASRLLPELPLFLMIAIATHLVMSFAQTLMHYKLGHRPMAVSSSATTSISITPIIPRIISSHGRTSVTKATIRPSSSSLCFWREPVHTCCCQSISSWFR